MDPEGLLAEAIGLGRAAKTHACRRTPHDIPPRIEVFRAEDPAATLVVRPDGRDELVALARLATVGFDADVVTMIHEVYLTLPEAAARNPVTGHPWQPGEIGDVVDNHQGIQKGWISEAVAASVTTRAGSYLAGIAPFRFIGKLLTWPSPAGWLRPDQPYTLGEDDGYLTMADPVGFIPDILVQTMTTPKASEIFDQVFPEAPGLLDREDRDIATAHYLMRHYPCQVALASPPENLDRVARLLDMAGPTSNPYPTTRAAGHITGRAALN